MNVGSRVGKAGKEGQGEEMEGDIWETTGRKET